MQAEKTLQENFKTKINFLLKQMKSYSLNDKIFLTTSDLKLEILIWNGIERVRAQSGERSAAEGRKNREKNRQTKRFIRHCWRAEDNVYPPRRSWYIFSALAL